MYLTSIDIFSLKNKCLSQNLQFDCAAVKCSSIQLKGKFTSVYLEVEFCEINRVWK